MIMKLKPVRLACALATLAFCGALPAAAQDAAYDPGFANQRPLMVIRFNQPRVAYEHPLYTTISRALDVKPSAMFDIVSVTPQAHDADSQSRYDAANQRNTQKVLSTLSQMGLPHDRIHVTTLADNVAASEVRIFVH
jgi:hypothetical protein